jgi:hypothetical protein
VPERRSIQSVGIHLLVLHSVLARGVAVERAMTIRRQALESRQRVAATLTWLDPPTGWPLRIDDVVAALDAEDRGRVADAYVEGVWSAWFKGHGDTLAAWHDALVDA